MVPTSTNSRLDVFEGLKNAIYKHSLKSHFHIILSSNTNITSNNQLNCPKKKNTPWWRYKALRNVMSADDDCEKYHYFVSSFGLSMAFHKKRGLIS